MPGLRPQRQSPSPTLRYINIRGWHPTQSSTKKTAPHWEDYRGTLKTMAHWFNQHYTNIHVQFPVYLTPWLRWSKHAHALYTLASQNGWNAIQENEDLQTWEGRLMPEDHDQQHTCLVTEEAVKWFLEWKDLLCCIEAGLCRNTVLNDKVILIAIAS